jgi:tetratricopeptide (TPR) repeat protein
MSLSKAENKRLHQARLLFEQDKVDEAYDIVRQLLLEHPHNYLCLQMAGHIYDKAGNIPVAYHFHRAATEANPRDANGWISYGRISEWLWRTEQAEKAYEKGLKFADRDATVAYACGNYAALCIDNARYEEAEAWARKCLELDPEDQLAKANIGFSQLATGNWAEGWKNYHHILGFPVRTKFQYMGEPEWDGSPGKTVVLYGEQGIGDELSFASMVPDAIAVCNRVIIDCDARLHGLFKRSFPQASVFGTRKYKPVTGRPAVWGEDKIDASLAIGQVGEFFRTDPSMCPGTPYLVPDPERVLMWRSLWATKQKPIIGIAWKGGTAKTGAHMRRWSLDALLPVLRAVDAHWVVLEYRSAAGELEEFKRTHPEIDIKEYPHGTLTSDYDDTAALVASLDLVFCVQTSVAHLGGALGVPTWVCVPPCSQWRYGAEGESIPWYKSMRVIRRGADWDFDKMGAELAAQFGNGLVCELRKAS